MQIPGRVQQLGCDSILPQHQTDLGSREQILQLLWSWKARTLGEGAAEQCNI
jgi:hypothetical protein